MLRRVVENSTRCGICVKKFSSMYSLKRHLKLQHKDAHIYPCQTCKMKFSSREHFVEHLPNCSNDGMVHFIRCRICQNKMSSPYSLKRHLETHKNTNIEYQSRAEEENIFSENEQLTRGGHYIRCGICHKKMSSAYSLKRHLKTHKSANIEYHCKVCTKIFSSKENFTEHLTGCSNYEASYSIRCGICQKQFSSSRSIARHSQTHENTNVEYQCQACDKVFLSANSFSEHLRKCSSHKGKSSYGNSKSDLKTQKSNRIEYQCRVCGDKFFSRKSFIKHLSNYTNDHQCKDCGKKFHRNHQLLKHWEESHSKLKDTTDTLNHAEKESLKQHSKFKDITDTLNHVEKEIYSEFDDSMDTMIHTEEESPESHEANILETEDSNASQNPSNFGCDSEPCVICREKFCIKMSCVNALEYAHAMVMKCGKT